VTVDGLLHACSPRHPIPAARQPLGIRYTAGAASSASGTRSGPGDERGGTIAIRCRTDRRGPMSTASTTASWTPASTGSCVGSWPRTARLGTVGRGLDAWLRGLPERERPPAVAARTARRGVARRADRRSQAAPRAVPRAVPQTARAPRPNVHQARQILSIREDLLPRSITDELQEPPRPPAAVPYDQFLDLIRRNCAFRSTRCSRTSARRPLGSASIGQIHLATLHGGEQVVVKAVKPGSARLCAATPCCSRAGGSCS